MEFDTKTLAVKGTWPLAPCEGPSALSADVAHHRLFAACDKVMAVIDVRITERLWLPRPSAEIQTATDYDPSTGMLFASCREAGSSR